MKKIYIYGCAVMAAVFIILAFFFLLSEADNDMALALFYGALICLVVPARHVERGSAG